MRTAIVLWSASCYLDDESTPTGTPPLKPRQHQRQESFQGYTIVHLGHGSSIVCKRSRMQFSWSCGSMIAISYSCPTVALLFPDALLLHRTEVLFCSIAAQLQCRSLGRYAFDHASCDASRPFSLYFAISGRPFQWSTRSARSRSVTVIKFSGLIPQVLAATWLERHCEDQSAPAQPDVRSTVSSVIAFFEACGRVDVCRPNAIMVAD